MMKEEVYAISQDSLTEERHSNSLPETAENSPTEEKHNHRLPDTSGTSNADFETAITATKFGKFNILLFLLSIPAAWTSVFETTTMSYVFPAARCDLNLSLHDGGSLNAITFIGMVSSGFIWGFLVDTLGRKKLMVVGYMLDAFFVIISSFSQSIIFLIILKFFGGFIINGPFAALTAYLSEFHSSKYRARIQMVRGIMISTGLMMLPILASVFLPQQLSIVVSDDIVLHSWNIFILICAIPSLLSCIIYMFLPESPKFLMTVGRNKEALSIFQQLYKYNTKNDMHKYPIKSLIDETQARNDQNQKRGGHITAGRTPMQALQEGCQQIKPLCFPPHIKHIILACIMQSLIMMAVNTLRLWLPQIFQSISDYEYYNNGTTSSICRMLESMHVTKDYNATECHVNFSQAVYSKSMIVAGVTILSYILAITVINKLGKKLLLVILSLAAGTCGLSIYFVQVTPLVVALSSIFLALGAVCSNIVLTIVIDLFPTSLRVVCISLVMICGRTASMLGNFLFPVLLKMGCAPPFFTVGCLIIACSFLVIFLPNTDLKPLI